MAETHASALRGKRIVITRAAAQSEALSKQLSVLGAIPVILPLVAFTEPEDFAPLDEALAQSKSGKPLIDVRSPGEYKGEITHMPEYPQEGVLRGGHVPGAKSMPWKTATNDDATFKPADELAKIYLDQCGVKPGTDTVVYCRIGERSSHTWFVLTYLLGLDKVRNYDGSWTEWGNKVGAPIEKGA